MVAKVGTLYTSPVTGHVCCPTHVPNRGSDTWRRGHWGHVTPREREAWPMAELGEMRCQSCQAIEARTRARLDGHVDPADGG